MIEKVRVHEIAKELGIASKDVLEKAKIIGLEVKSAQSVVTMEQAEGLANYIMNGETPVVTSEPEKKAPTKAKSDTPKKEDTPEQVKETVSPEPKEEPVAKNKVEEPKEEPKSEVKAQEKKEEPKEVKAEVKAEVKKDEKKSTGPVIITQIKRSGLKIVKKRKPKVEESYNLPQKQASVSSYGKMSAEVLEELAQKKRSKSSSTARKQEQGRRMDIFGGSMSDVSMDMDDQVTLLDLNATERAPLPVEDCRWRTRGRCST